jgi:hypothetical protein
MFALLKILQNIRANSLHKMPFSLYLAGPFHRKPSYLSLTFTNIVVLGCYNWTKPPRLCSGWRLDQNLIFQKPRDQELTGSKILRSHFSLNSSFSGQQCLETLYLPLILQNRCFFVDSRRHPSNG